jgi:signal transduction histidine kinase
MEGYPSRPRVLIVDDVPENIQLLTEMLQDDCLAIAATNGVQALKLANADPAPDIILLDVVMPGMSGYEVCTRLKAEPGTRNIPVIFVTTLADKDEEHKGLELGGADYISRPLNANLVKTRIRYQLEIKRYRARQQAAEDLVTESIIARPDLLQELAERRRVQEELVHLNTELELRLVEAHAQLAAAQDERRYELQRHTEDRLEIGLLNENLARQRRDFEMVSQELESLGFSISHDLRAPLRHLLGFSGALLEDYGATLDATAQSFLRCIVKSGQKMEAQIEALLSLSRVSRQHLSFDNVNLSHLVREAAALLQGTEPGRRAEFTISDHLVVRADATLLRTAIDQLMGNAWKFTKGKDAAQIEFGQRQEGSSAVYYLRDNGAGFDMRYADRLFGAFQRMHKESEFVGAGIGLATAQRIIRRHGGRIWADATVDLGATFFFTLSE